MRVLREHMKSLFITLLRLMSWVFPLFLPIPYVGNLYSAFQVQLGTNQHELIWWRLTKFHKPLGQVQFEVIFKHFGWRWTCFNILTKRSEFVLILHNQTLIKVWNTLHFATKYWILVNDGWNNYYLGHVALFLRKFWHLLPMLILHSFYIHCSLP